MKFAYLFLLCFLIACNEHQPAVHDTLRVGVLPDQSEATLRNRYAPLLSHLQQQTGLDIELVVPQHYADMVTRFDAGEIDIANFGGLTFLQSHNRKNAQPLVMRQADSRFTSWFLVRKNNPAQSIAELQGHSFSFGSELSTSGHLMPRHFMQEELQLTPEQHFGSIFYSGAHDETAIWVAQGKVDAGVANSKIIQKMFEDGRLSREDVRVLWETPPYTDYVWAIRNEVNGSLRVKLRDAFLHLDIDNPSHKVTLNNIDAQLFYPADMDNFKQLSKVAIKLGLLSHE